MIKLDAVRETSEGGYIVAGSSISFGSSTDIWVLKLDSSGNVAWEKTYGGSDYDQASSIGQTPDGGYFLAGHSQSFGAGGKDVVLLKLDATGSVDWQKTFGGSSDDYSYAIDPDDPGWRI